MSNDAWNSLFTWLELHWLSLLIAMVVLTVLEELGKAIVHSIADSGQLRREKRRAQLRERDDIRAQRLALEEQRFHTDVLRRRQQGVLPTPGPCVHRNVKQVRTADGELVGWLCQKLGCDKQLPPDWAVAAEDLPAPQMIHGQDG